MHFAISHDMNLQLCPHISARSLVIYQTYTNIWVSRANIPVNSFTSKYGCPEDDIVIQKVINESIDGFADINKYVKHIHSLYF